MKSEFLVVYDYGMGGVWGIAQAESRKSLCQAFPELTIVDDPPPWIDEAEMEKMRRIAWFDIDDALTFPSWIQALISERTGY